MIRRRLFLGFGVATAFAVPLAASPLIVHAANTGTITITESIGLCQACSATGGAETSDPGLFNLQIDGATAGTGANVGTGGTTGAVSVTATDSTTTPPQTGVHTIWAAPGTSTSTNQYLASYSCTDGTLTTTGDATVPFSVTVGTNGASITCTITDKRGDGGGQIAESLLGSGSDTTQFMMHDLDKTYMFSPGCQQIQLPTGSTKFYDFSCLAPDPAGIVKSENYAHDQAHEAYFLGSGNGIHQLCNQGKVGNAHIDYARSSRASSASDCTGLHFVAYARDGISWEAFDDGTTASGTDLMNNQNTTCAGSGTAGASPYCLTQAQLKGIFLQPCSITNWNQVGGQNVPISIYTPQSGSGTRATFDSFLGGSSDQCIPAAQQASHIIPENANSAIPLSDRGGAIFPFSAGVWQTTINGIQNSHLNNIDNVAPDAADISSGAFPFGRFLFNVFCATCASKNPNGDQVAAAANYVGEEGWICKQNNNITGWLSTGHTKDANGNFYRVDIANNISQNGFVTILAGTIGGGDTKSDFCRLFTT